MFYDGITLDSLGSVCREADRRQSLVSLVCAGLGAGATAYESSGAGPMLAFTAALGTLVAANVAMIKHHDLSQIENEYHQRTQEGIATQEAAIDSSTNVTAIWEKDPALDPKSRFSKPAPGYPLRYMLTDAAVSAIAPVALTYGGHDILSSALANSGTPVGGIVMACLGISVANVGSKIATIKSVLAGSGQKEG